MKITDIKIILLRACSKITYHMDIIEVTKELAKSAAKELIGEDHKIYQWLKSVARDRLFSRALKGRVVNSSDLHRICLEHYVPVTQPLVLISQIQRSGGTLLSQLFDGHPECHAHPHELKIGHPTKDIWPKINLNDNPEQWFKTLFEFVTIKLAQEGYKKGRKDESFSFLFLPSLQREIFLKYISSINTISLRDVFDGYMTSFFNAWLNNQNFNGPKKIVTCFTAGLSKNADSMTSFFEIYSDGRLISIIRDPCSWYASAREHKSKAKWFGEISSALDYWNQSAKAMVRNRERYGDRVCIIRFEDLISKTEAVMSSLAKFAGITYQDALLVPSFNKWPIRANTSFDIKATGVVSDPLSRFKLLDKSEIEFIERESKEIYQRVLQQSISIDSV